MTTSIIATEWESGDCGRLEVATSAFAAAAPRQEDYDDGDQHGGDDGDRDGILEVLAIQGLRTMLDELSGARNKNSYAECVKCTS